MQSFATCGVYMVESNAATKSRSNEMKKCERCLKYTYPSLDSRSFAAFLLPLAQQIKKKNLLCVKECLRIHRI